MSFSLPYDRGRIGPSAPCQPSAVVEPGPFPSQRDETVLSDAMDAPIGCPPIEDLAGRGRRVTVVIPDLTRRAAVATFLPHLLKRLERAGCRAGDVLILVALGIHRPMTETELSAHVTKGVFANYRVVNHRPDDPDSLVSVGSTPLGLPVSLNRSVVETDLLVLTGGATYHYFAGYGGGRKALLPGVAGRASCEAHHRLVVDFHRGRIRGALACGVLDGNPVHDQMAAVCGMVPTTFSLSVVTDPEGRIVAARAGEVHASHRAACADLDQFYRRRIGAPARLVVASAGGWPRDINMVQSHKALYSAHRAVSRDGAVVLAAACRDGAGHPDFMRWFEWCGTDDEWLDRLDSAYQINGQTAYSTFRRAREHRTFLVSGLDPGVVRRMGMVPCVGLDEALCLAERHLGGLPAPLVIPDASDILIDAEPVVKQPG